MFLLNIHQLMVEKSVVIFQQLESVVVLAG